jgi:hypothetical protein
VAKKQFGKFGKKIGKVLKTTKLNEKLMLRIIETFKLRFFLIDLFK